MECLGRRLAATTLTSELLHDPGTSQTSKAIAELFKLKLSVDKGEQVTGRVDDIVTPIDDHTCLLELATDSFNLAALVVGLLDVDYPAPQGRHRRLRPRLRHTVHPRAQLHAGFTDKMAALHAARRSHLRSLPLADSGTARPALGAEWERRCPDGPPETHLWAAGLRIGRALTCGNALKVSLRRCARSVRIEGPGLQILPSYTFRLFRVKERISKLFRFPILGSDGPDHS